MRRIFLQSFKALLTLTLLTGFLYPLAVTGISYLLFKTKAEGSLLTNNGKELGSSLLGQKFTKDNYFWSRLSAIDYQTVASGASQLGPTSLKLKERVALDLKKYNMDPTSKDLAYDFLLSSGSGLDPHISPQNARFQSIRVAQSRGISVQKILFLIEENTETPSFGVLGRPRINVLKINLALDQRTE